VRRQLKERRGGADDAKLVAVVCTLSTERQAGDRKETQVFEEQGRFYRLPTKRDLEAVRKAGHIGVLSLVPDEPLPPVDGVLAKGEGFRHEAVGCCRGGRQGQGKAMRLVVDTNVFILGVFFGGAPYEVPDAWRRMRFLSSLPN